MREKVMENGFLGHGKSWKGHGIWLCSDSGQPVPHTATILEGRYTDIS